jgi:hypothetical protein
MVLSHQQLSKINEPEENDVLLGHGSKAYYGSVVWHALVEANKAQYKRQSSQDRAITAKSIVLTIRGLEPPGRFLKKDADTGLWYDAGDLEAGKVTSQALRGNERDGSFLDNFESDSFPYVAPSVPNRRMLQKSKHVRDLRALSESPCEASLEMTCRHGQSERKPQENSLVEIFARAMNSHFAMTLEAKEDHVDSRSEKPLTSQLPTTSSGMSSDGTEEPTELEASESCALGDLDDIDESLSIFFRSNMSLGTFDISDTAGVTSDASNRGLPRRFQRGPSNASLLIATSNMSLMSNISLISVFSNE